MSSLWKAGAPQRPPEDSHQKRARGKAVPVPVQDLPLSLHQDEPGHSPPSPVPQSRRVHQGLLSLLLERRGKVAGRGNPQCQQEASGEEKQAGGEKNRTSDFLCF